MHYLIEAAIDRSEKAIQRRLLSHSELCESCKRIPQLVSRLSRIYEEIEEIHHATLSDLESAATEGCRLCDPLWKWYLQDRVAAQPPGHNRRGHRDFQSIRGVFQGVSDKRHNLHLSIETEKDYVRHLYAVRLVAGKLTGTRFCSTWMLTAQSAGT